jgi:hypothetical protein
LENPADDIGHPVPVPCLFLELLPTGGREMVVPGLALVFGLTPFANNETVVLQTIKSGIEGTLVNL